MSYPTERWKIKGWGFSGMIGNLPYSAWVLGTWAYWTRVHPEAQPVEVWTILFEGLLRRDKTEERIGPWVVDVEARKATYDFVKMAIENTIRGMLGIP